MRIINYLVLLILLLPTLVYSADFADSDQLYIWDAAGSVQYFPTYSLFKTKLDETFATDASLGTAAFTDSTAYATAAQGATADTALQPADIGTAGPLDVGTTIGDVVQVADVGYCSDTQYTDQTTCDSNSQTWTPVAGLDMTAVNLPTAAGYQVGGVALTATDLGGATAAQGTHADTAFGWGDHAAAGYLTSESDPVFSAWDKDYADLINKPTIPTSGTDFDPVGTDNSTNVTIAAGVNALILSGQQLDIDSTVEQLADLTPTNNALIGFDSGGNIENKTSITADIVLEDAVPSAASGHITYDAANKALRVYNGATVDVFNNNSTAVVDNSSGYTTYRLDDCSTATGMVTGDICFEY